VIPLVLVLIGSILMSSSSEPTRAEEGVNRLIREKSPYLLQHAHNPVDWYPWGDEAFDRARSENKPIFLSIGYSTCHWCHVMEKESFEDAEVAGLMNDLFVSIKVDREERPDIDGIYMTVCQMMTGRGGWPLTIIMTPDGKPFYAATYIPRETRFNQIGMLELVPRIEQVWEERKDEVENSAEKVSKLLGQVPEGGVSGEELGEEVLAAAYGQLARSFDDRYGGFGSAPKFPTPQNLLFLLRYWKRTGDERVLQMVEKTLRSMRFGGIYDHIGFGFHRYSTDRKWLVPHFEKMLYDQAMLAMACTEAYQATGRDEYQETVRQIFEYVLRDMTAPEGGFYSAEDADSEGEEGKFYLWTEEEIRPVLSAEESALVIRVFNVEERGNFAEEATGKTTGRNILYLEEPFSAIAADLDIDYAELRDRVESARRKLFAVRERRVHPHKDDKVLTDWNGLMIAALAKAAQAFDEPRYAEAAGRSADFVLANLRDSTGRLLHRYRGGEAAIPGFLDDYAFLVLGLTELYEATFQLRYLRTALDLNTDMVRLFWDEKSGGFYFTADDAENLLFREKQIYDGAVPSGNSVAMLNLLRLGRMIADPGLEKRAAQLGGAFSAQVLQAPSAHTQLMVALDFGMGPSYEVVVVGDERADDTRAMLKAIRKQFVPNKVLLFRPGDVKSPEISKLAEFTRQQRSIKGKATAYVCLDYQCKLPTTDVEETLKLLGL
jgi:uncharacterized protein YyaL (SSP411 family)